MLTAAEIQVVIDRIRDYPEGEAQHWFRDAEPIQKAGYGYRIENTAGAAYALESHPEFAVYG